MSRVVPYDSMRSARGGCVIARQMPLHDVRSVVRPVYRPMRGDQEYELIIETNCGPDDQFSSPKQCNYSSALGKVLICGSAAGNGIHVRDPGLSFFSKYACGTNVTVDSDAGNFYWSSALTLIKANYSDPRTTVQSLAVNNIRMIDFASDPDYGFITSNNTTDGHGVRMIQKSDMTVVASLLATGSGDGQFNNPLGVKYYNGFLYVCDTTNLRVVKISVNRTPGAESLTFDSNINTSPYAFQDMCMDGSYWYVATGNFVRKYDINFNYAGVNISSTSNSICLIPDQGDGNGPTLCVVSSTNSNIKRHKCSNLSLITTVGSAGDGSASSFDPTISYSAPYVGYWQMDDGSIFLVASAANISWNGFSGYTFRSPGPHRAVFKGVPLSAITAIDGNADILTAMKNMRRCANVASVKAQSNVGLVLNLAEISPKAVTVWAYGCGTGIQGSIRHLIAATSINLRENGASQAQVDAWIDDLYSNKDVMAPATVNLNGTNAAPSAAAKAKADELVSSYGWSIAYSS